MKTGLLNPTPLTPDAMGHAPIVDLVDMAPGHAESAALLAKARAFAEPLLLTERFETGEDALAHADGVSLILHGIGAPPSLRGVAYLVYASQYLTQPEE
nr:GTP pyrophosphokinase [Aquabacterium sp.]